MFTKEAEQYFKGLIEELVALIQTLCGIPAPSGKEEKRATFCKQWLQKAGATSVYLDEKNNVIYPVNCWENKKIILFCAHTDTVFPDEVPMPFINDGEYLHSPGVGDNTTCLAMLLLVARYVAQHSFSSEYGILFVFNSCEEGLGNLQGIKQVMKAYGERVAAVYAFDATYNHMFCECVGSQRYKITIRTKGGHSFYDYGNANAIALAANFITKLYTVQVPKLPNTKTTYNVGEIHGGCSVNTIAQESRFLYEYRSNTARCLKEMEQQFWQTVEQWKKENEGEITVETVGTRLCSQLKDTALLEKMTKRGVEITQKHTGAPCLVEAASTDCNLPMSMGIPAVCLGAYMGEGAHTREERVRLDSLPIGLGIVAETVLEFLEEKEE